jgi:hypothetical protein
MAIGVKSTIAIVTTKIKITTSALPTLPNSQQLNRAEKILHSRFYRFQLKANPITVLFATPVNFG